MQGKVILVAGGSSGLGRATAECLARDGHTVYAAARSLGGGKAPEGCRGITMDVTDEEQVRACVNSILQAEGHLDVLVCCAASFTMAPLEELPCETLRSMMDVNFLGDARLVQAVLPGMRSRGSGHIFLFSSLNGLFSIPFQGAYSATKHAVEAYGQALAQELSGTGVQVTLVEPGDCRGGSEKYRHRHILPGSPYEDFFRHGTARIHHDESNGLVPEKVGTAIARAVRSSHPPRRLKVASLDQRSAVWMNRFFPRKLFDHIITGYYRNYREK